MNENSGHEINALDRVTVALAVSDYIDNDVIPETAEVSALKFCGDRVIDRLHLTGPLSRSATELALFVGNAPVVGYGISSRVGQLFPEQPSTIVWDIEQIAAFVVGNDSNHSLESLAGAVLNENHLGKSVSDLADLSRLVYVILVQHMLDLGRSFILRLGGMMLQMNHPLSTLLNSLANVAHLVGDIENAGNYSDISQRLGRARPIGSPNQFIRVTSEDIESLMKPGGPFSRRFPHYEQRVEQVDMAKAVALALSVRDGCDDPQQLIVEGGTGIGKSIAYLVPAILHASRNNLRVLISTSTINLQSQLIEKDIPDLLETLSGDSDLDLNGFRYAQMKGRANYLCIRRWAEMASRYEINLDEMKILSKSAPWLKRTMTGDRNELDLSVRELGVWDRMSSASLSNCAGLREGGCFYRHARDQAAGAHIVVVNHALLLSDVMVEGSLLPQYDALIVDEAHNLEDEATRQFGFRIFQGSVDELLDRLLASLQSVPFRSKIGAIFSGDDIGPLVSEITREISHGHQQWAGVLQCLAAFVSERGEDENKVSAQHEVRITEGLRARPTWSDVEIAWDNFEHSMSSVAGHVDSLLRLLGSIDVEEDPEASGFIADFGEWSVDQLDLRLKIAGFVSRPMASMVYWLVADGHSLSLNGAPLDVSSILNDKLFSRKNSIVLTSATLTVRDHFTHVKTRLGLEAPSELSLGSPFDFRKSALLCLPDDLPRLDSSEYEQTTAQGLRDLAVDANGFTMGLFTSHRALRQASASLRSLLTDHGINVLAQGEDGTPSQIIARFRTNPRALLLGTSSFWEGVDIGNEFLKILVLVRLPFSVPTDPIFEARSAEYERPFVEYALPQAVLRFRQGFGRLIRGKDDRGAVVVLDRRISSSSYGRAFLQSIPPTTVFRGPLSDAIKGVKNWLTLGTGQL